MKLNLVFAVSALSASAAMAAAPNTVVGAWKRQPVTGVAGGPFSTLKFTADGRLFASPGFPRALSDTEQLVGRYESEDDKVIAQSQSGEAYAYQLMKDGRLCVFPAPAVLPLDGAPRVQKPERQCYERVSPAG